MSKAKHCAAAGPVFITDRGRTAHVLLTIESYLEITNKDASLGELLGMPQTADIDFDPPRLKGKLYDPMDLS